MAFDTIAEVETPEGIALRLHAAGPIVRCLAWMIDSVIRVAIYCTLAFVLSRLGALGFGVISIAIFFTEWFYPVIGEVYFQGRSPGKKALGLRVLHDDGTPIGWPASLVRNLIRAVDFLPVCYVFGLFAMFFSREFKRLGDLAAGTVVVYCEPKQLPKATVDVPPMPPPCALNMAERQALMAYSERSGDLSTERRNELASIATPLVLAGADPHRCVLGVAAWLEGRR